MLIGIILLIIGEIIFIWLKRLIVNVPLFKPLIYDLKVLIGKTFYPLILTVGCVKLFYVTFYTGLLAVILVLSINSWISKQFTPKNIKNRIAKEITKTYNQMLQEFKDEDENSIFRRILKTRKDLNYMNEKSANEFLRVMNIGSKTRTNLENFINAVCIYERVPMDYDEGIKAGKELAKEALNRFKKS